MPHSLATPSSAQGRIAIVDIGSNSIRMVVYDQIRRAPAALYNEKVMCQLGKGLALSGKLNPEGVVMAREAIARYLALINVMEVTELHVFATAAVRDASDGEAFTKSLERKHNIHIETISGKREAKLGAYGVLSSIYKPSGITGDLGGGSMELVSLSDQHIHEQVTLPIGPLRLIDEAKGDIVRTEQQVKKAFGGVKWLKGTKCPHFYAIGGGFRALARLHMEVSDYPVDIVHEYAVKSKPMLEFLKDFLTLTPQQILTLPTVSAKRAAALPATAVVLKQVIEALKPGEIVFSASGIREGYLYEKLSPYVRDEDVLIAGCTDYANRIGRSAAFAHEMATWMAPVIGKESASFARLRLAFCLLYDVARYIHPEYRAVWSYHRILQSGFNGMTHKERVQLALALYHRHQTKCKNDLKGLGLIGAKEKAWALLVGSLANLAYHLTGGIPGTLPDIKLEVTRQKLQLKLPKSLEALNGEAIKKRLQSVEEAYAEWVEA